MLPSNINQPGNFLRNRLAFFNMVQMSWIVTDLIDVGGNQLGHFIILLQVDGESRGGLCPDRLEGSGFFRVINRNTYDASPSLFKLMDLRHSSINIDGF